MGRLGWTYDQTLDTPVSAIELALDGRVDFVAEILTAVFGKSEDTPPKSPTDDEVQAWISERAARAERERAH